MKVTELKNDGEKRTATVDEYGRISIGRKYAEKEIEVAFEVQE